jgi:hypothetical protein
VEVWGKREIPWDNHGNSRLKTIKKRNLSICYIAGKTAFSNFIGAQ